MQIFVTGTDTNVGKTVISSWLALRMNAHYWKPIQTCAPNEEDDAKVVQRIAKLPENRIIPSAYSFNQPVSPHLAAKLAGQAIDFDSFKLPKISPLIVEGAGGVMTPINDDYKIIDLIKKFNILTVIVARSSIGTINHTCLTIEALRSRNIQIWGVIMNGPKNIDNKQAIEKYGKVKVLVEFEHIDNLNYDQLKRAYERQ